jgi:hypothetical protein
MNGTFVDGIRDSSWKNKLEVYVAHGEITEMLNKW